MFKTLFFSLGFCICFVFRASYFLSRACLAWLWRCQLRNFNIFVETHAMRLYIFFKIQAGSGL